MYEYDQSERLTRNTMVKIRVAQKFGVAIKGMLSPKLPRCPTFGDPRAAANQNTRNSADTISRMAVSAFLL
jgi:hypothetical protein